MKVKDTVVKVSERLSMLIQLILRPVTVLGAKIGQRFPWLARLANKLLAKTKGVLGVFIAWVVVYLIFVFLIGHFQGKPFLTPDNFELMMRQAVIVGLGAIGMSYVIMTGGIDLSPGSTIALTTVIVGLTLKATNNPFLGILASLVVGLIAGMINGILVAKLKVGAFIVTLATMLIFRGVAKGFAHEQTVGSVPSTWLEAFTAALGKSETWQIIPKGAWVWLALLVIMTLV
ncbi:MAG: hypothetical protein WCG75_06305, partial [Armatimonadota bacterium]